MTLLNVLETHAILEEHGWMLEACLIVGPDCSTIDVGCAKGRTLFYYLNVLKSRTSLTMSKALLSKSRISTQP